MDELLVIKDVGFSIVKKLESAEYGEMCTVRFADGLETDVLACDIVL